MQNPYHVPPLHAMRWTPYTQTSEQITDDNRYEVLLMFYKPQAKDHYFNHFVKALSSGDFSHVEIGFPSYARKYVPEKHATEDTRILYGSSIFQNSKVFFQEKEYSRTGYTSIGILTNKARHDMLIAYCQNAAQRGVGFDGYGMICASLPIIITQHDANLTFCSKFVTDALQYANISEVKNIDSRNTTPSSLYNHIRNNMRKYNVVTASPAKLRQFTAVQ